MEYTWDNIVCLCLLINLQIEATPSEMAAPTYSPESFVHLNPRGLPSITSLLDTPAEQATAIEDVSLNCRHTRVMKDYKGDIHKKLREGLQWMFNNELQPKLEGR